MVSGLIFSLVYSGAPAKWWGPSSAEVCPWRSQASRGMGWAERSVVAWSTGRPVSTRVTVNSLGWRWSSSISGAVSAVGWYTRDARSWRYDPGGRGGPEDRRATTSLLV